MAYKCVCSHVALRLPDGTLVPVWDGVHARQVNAREYDGWGEVVIELIKLVRVS